MGYDPPSPPRPLAQPRDGGRLAPTPIPPDVGDPISTSGGWTYAAGALALWAICLVVGLALAGVF